MKKLLVKNIGLLATPEGTSAHRGSEQGKIKFLKDAWVLIEDGVIASVGTGEAPAAEGAEIVDAEGKLVTPGLVDAHTHLIFGGWRQNELGMKLHGKTYLEIQNAGGGIQSTTNATRQATEQAIARLYGNEGTARVIEEMKREAGTAAPDIVPAQMTGETADSAPTIRFVNSLIERAFHERASDIHLEPQESEMVVRMRIDGLLQRLFTVPTELQSTVISRLKIMGGMNIAEHKIPQDGQAVMQLKGHEVDLRISSLPTVYGEKIVLRLLDKTDRNLDKESLGIEGRDLELYNALLKNTGGVILLVGPTGSGKSTTLYAMIRDLARDEVNIVTLEDPVEYHIPGVSQCQINEKTGMTFANGLRAILRQDPDIISVGEIRDGETAGIAMRSAITGHLVMSTLHTNDAISAVYRLRDIGVEPWLVASALRGVISQRLVRKICPHCKTAYQPSEEELALLGMPEDSQTTFYKGVGCPECRHTGYVGRRAAFEILMVNREVRRLVNDDAAYDELLAAAKKNGYRTMRDSCRDLVLRGITTAEEAARTINSTMDE